MNYESINYNEVLISGEIKSIRQFNKYIMFGLKCNTYSNIKSNCYISFHIYEDLYKIYKDLFFKENKVFVKGYLNSYSDSNNKIVSYVKVTDISNNPDDIIKGRKSPHIRYDEDGVMVWDGKRCESTQPTKEEMAELENLLQVFE